MIVAGDGDQLDFLKNYIKSHQLSRYITYLGFCNDVSYQFNNIDVLVLPTHYECFPMILIESMSTGTPVIASNVGGVSEMVEDGYNGFLVEAENKNDFINRIVYYINNRSKIEEHGRNAKHSTREKYSKENMLSQYTEVYKMLLE